MAKKGLVFLKNTYPRPGEFFTIKHVYRFIPEFETTFNDRGIKKKRTVTTFIELELYTHDICVISFFNKGFGTGKKKYRVRCNLGVGHIRSIVKACIDAYFLLTRKKGHFAFVFSAADDVGEHKEHNKRFALYTRYIDDYFIDREIYQQHGSIGLNTFMLLHPHHPHQKECMDFMSQFDMRVFEDMNNPKEEYSK